MRLEQATWPEIEAYLQNHTGIMLPVGSTEQHGPMGLIGTDTICATAIAERAADLTGSYVSPSLAYTPAPFNTGFPGTISVSEPVFSALFGEIIAGLTAQGFRKIYVLNGHGANLAPMRHTSAGNPAIRIRSWWDFADVNALRETWFGDWEGLHATPSEISITQALIRAVPAGSASDPPAMLSKAERQSRAGDRHGPPDRHRREFPDGRVGAHSALARPEHGRKLLQAASEAVAKDFGEFISGT